MEKVSIIIPVFNSEKTIYRCLSSIICSEFKDYEIIVCNDGSTDQTDSEIRRFFRKHSSIKHKLLNIKNNSGISTAKNLCIKNSIGEYIASIDSDDTMNRKRLGLQVDFLDKNPSITVVGTSQKFRFSDNNYKINKPPKNDKFIKAGLFVRTTILHPTIMIRSKFIKDNNITYSNSHKFCEDHLYFIDIKNKGGSFANLLQLTDNYDFSGPKVWSNNSDKEMMNSIRKIWIGILTDISIPIKEKYLNNLMLLSHRKLIRSPKECIELIIFIGILLTKVDHNNGGKFIFFLSRLKDIIILLRKTIIKRIKKRK
tara:strand:- start:1024 stop:1959 length:936 start_codon:yes stop_codon:yes gene_type:complete